MAIQSYLLSALLILWLILVPGALLSAATEPHPATGTPPASTAIPAGAEDQYVELSGEPLAAAIGSSVPSTESEPDLSEATVDQSDPWAEAFVESVGFVPSEESPDVPAYHVVMNREVGHFLDRFTGPRRDVVSLWVSRSGRYLDMIRQVLRRHRLPDDLAVTAMIESGFNPLAVSRAGAKGLWQFMAGTARRYGLRVDQWVDERLDAEKSTVAAASYLRDLYGQFGSWLLAQAAYNAGEVTVERAIRATGSKDFWTLAGTGLLRRETKDFVPQIQAAAMIARDPYRYGFEFLAESAGTVDRVSVPPSTDLRRLSAVAGLSLEVLRSLNPVLIRGVTPPGGAYDLKVPSGTRDSVLAALAPARSSFVAQQSGARTVRASRHADVHVVRPRDTLSSIAKRYGVSVSDVLRWNSLKDHDQIRPGDRLRISDARSAGQREGQASTR